MSSTQSTRCTFSLFHYIDTYSTTSFNLDIKIPSYGDVMKLATDAL